MSPFRMIQGSAWAPEIVAALGKHLMASLLYSTRNPRNTWANPVARIWLLTMGCRLHDPMSKRLPCNAGPDSR